MFDRIVHIAGNITCALLFTLFGGYTFAAIVYSILTKVLNFIGYTITVDELIASIPGFIILILSCLIFGIIGYFIGDAFQK